MTEVAGYGSETARIMLVGEAPAATEVRIGRPFQGRAGEELDRLLAASGIDRNDLYITNISLEPVTGDKDRFFFPTKNVPSTTYLQGIAQCVRDIQRIRPNVVVPMGNYALWGLMMLRDITRRRGSMYWSPIANVKVIPTLHPAALLRGGASYAEGSQGGMYKMRTPVVWDFDRIKEQSAFPELLLTKRRICVDPKGSDEDEAIARLLGAETITVDIESFGGTRLACIGLSDGDPTWSVVFPTDGRDYRRAILKRILEGDSRKVGQNLMYDVTMLDQNGIYVRNVWWDTMLAQFALWPELPKGLDFLTSVYTDIPYYKDEGKVWKQAHTDAALRTFFEYNGKDGCATTEIAQKQAKELADRNLETVFRRMMAVFEPLRQATYHGCRIDIPSFQAASVDIDRQLTEAQTTLREIAGCEVNANSPKQVAELLYEQRGLPKRTKDGRVTTDAKNLLDLAARYEDPALRAIVTVRKAQKLRSNYYNDKILSPDHRVRFTWNIAGTKTGRLSSAAPLWGPGMNGQNLPPSVRRVFIADEGFELWELDQSQAEAVITAYLAEDPVHIDCFRNGKDVHRVTACYLLDMDPSKWADIPKDHPMRQIGKKCNHAFNYDMQWMTFMHVVNSEYNPDDPNSVKLDPALAKEIREKYMASRPALPGYWARIRAELRATKTLRTPLGRERMFLDQWSDAMLRDAYSYKPQSTVGDSTNIGITQVYASADDDIRYLFKNGMRLWGQVHDSAVWQVPVGARQYAMKLMQTMEVPLTINGHNICVPIEGQAGPSWYKHDMDGLGMSRRSCELGDD